MSERQRPETLAVGCLAIGAWLGNIATALNPTAGVVVVCLLILAAYMMIRRDRRSSRP